MADINKLSNKESGFSTRNKINNNLDALNKQVNTIGIGEIPKQYVPSYADLATTYPNPELGWTVYVSGMRMKYKWNGNEWVVVGSDDSNAVLKAEIQPALNNSANPPASQAVYNAVDNVAVYMPMRNYISFNNISVGSAKTLLFADNGVVDLGANIYNDRLNLIPLIRSGQSLFLKMIVETAGEVYHDYNCWVDASDVELLTVTPTKTVIDASKYLLVWELSSVPANAKHFRVAVRPYGGGTCKIHQFYASYVNVNKSPVFTGDTQSSKTVADLSSQVFGENHDLTGEGLNFDTAKHTISANFNGSTNRNLLGYRIIAPGKYYLNGKVISKTGNVQNGISFDWYFYKQANGIFDNRETFHYSLKAGAKFSIPFEITSNDVNAYRIYINETIAGQTNVDIADISITNVSVNDSDVVERTIIYSDFNTLDEAIKSGAKLANIGSKVWRKIRQGQTDTKTEVNRHTHYYTDHPILRSKALKNLRVVDFKGYIFDNYNKGRYLSLITSDGYMYFRDCKVGRAQYGTRIKTEDFLSTLISHDGSGTDASRMEWLDMPSNQTLAEKQARLAQELPKWLMVDDVQYNNLAEELPNDANFQFADNTMEFENGNVFSSEYLYRPNGSQGRAKLTNALLCNPTHLIIKQGGSVIHEIALKDHAPLLRWGQMKADQGAITYNDVIYAALNFHNGKSITVPVSLNAGTYEIVIRSRRYGTTCVDGSVSVVSNAGLVGNIAMTGGILADANNSATLSDTSGTFTLSSSITQLTLTANCAYSKDLIFGNGLASIPRWGFQSVGKYGIVTEYVNTGGFKRSGLAYFTADNGETWEAVFDVGLHEFDCNIGEGHIHGACIDKYWNKLFIICGDSEHTKGIYYTDLFTQLSTRLDVDNVAWHRDLGEYPFYGTGYREQYITGFAMPDNVMFGTDCAPDGVFRMNRINADTITRREPSLLTGAETIAHIPTMFSRKDDNSPVFILSMRGGTDHPIREYNTSLLHVTLDGIYIEEIWKDAVKHSGFGDNSYMNVYQYNNYVFISFYGDGRFENNRTLIIGEL